MRQINWKLFDTLGKLFVGVVILGLVCNLAWLHLFPQGQEARMDEQRQRCLELFTQVDSAEIPLSDFSSGSWVFTDEEWELRLYPDNDKQFTLIPDAVRGESSGFDHQNQIESFKKIGGTERKLNDGWSIWETEKDIFAQVMITHNDKVQVIRSKMHGARGLTVVERRPKLSETNEVDSLLPILEGVEQVGVKENENGRVVVALLKAHSNAESDLMDFWRSEGWDVRPLVEAESASESPSNTTSGLRRRHRCVKSQSIVDVTYLQSLDETTILLTRVK